MYNQRVKMTERFQYFHNPEKKVCVAVCPPKVLEEIYWEEIMALQSFLKKRMPNLGLVELHLRYPWDFPPKLTARATCSDEEEYSYEIGEALSGERLKLKIMDRLYNYISDLTDCLADFTGAVLDYSNEVLYDRVIRQINAVDTYENSLGEN